MIAERLKMVREKWQLSQNRMSLKIGISQSTYSRIEAGKLSISEDALMGLAKARVNTNWLLTGEGEMLLSESSEAAGDLKIELEERIRRIKIDVSDIEDTVRRLFQNRG
jgi:transcriptional regulator with XRE-family HTH domain